MAINLDNQLVRKLGPGVLVAAIVIALVVGFNSARVEAKRSALLPCLTLQAGYEYADRQSTIAVFQGKKAGVAAWNQVGGTLGQLYLNTGCVNPDDATI